VEDLAAAHTPLFGIATILNSKQNMIGVLTPVILPSCLRKFECRTWSQPLHNPARNQRNYYSTRRNEALRSPQEQLPLQAPLAPRAFIRAEDIARWWLVKVKAEKHHRAPRLTQPLACVALPCEMRYRAQPQWSMRCNPPVDRPRSLDQKDYSRNKASS
jgi:hypothetical protein